MNISNKTMTATTRSQIIIWIFIICSGYFTLLELQNLPMARHPSRLHTDKTPNMLFWTLKPHDDKPS